MQEDSDSIGPIEQFTRKIQEKGIIHQGLLEYLGISDIEQSEDIILILKKYNIMANKCEFREVLETVSHLWENHQSKKEIRNKFRSLIKILKEGMKTLFSEKEIFHIFHFSNDNFILLLLVEQNILSVGTLINCIDLESWHDRNIVKYFYPEIREHDGKYFNELMITHKRYGFQKFVEKNDLNLQFFYEIRKEGEKEDKIIELIREDRIDEFILFVENASIDLNKKIHEEETILKAETIKLTPIKYSALFSSIKIFKYLLMKGVNLNVNDKDNYKNIIEYAIQGRNYEIIHFLEERKEIKEELSNPKNQLKCLEMSVKMHHNEIFEYFMTNFNFQESQKIIYYLLKYHNYQLIDQLIKRNQIEFKDKAIITQIFCCICENKNEEIVKILINQPNIDINSKDEIFDH